MTKRTRASSSASRASTHKKQASEGGYTFVSRQEYGPPPSDGQQGAYRLGQQDDRFSASSRQSSRFHGSRAPLPHLQGSEHYKEGGSDPEPADHESRKSASTSTRNTASRTRSVWSGSTKAPSSSSLPFPSSRDRPRNLHRGSLYEDDTRQKKKHIPPVIVSGDLEWKDDEEWSDDDASAGARPRKPSTDPYDVMVAGGMGKVPTQFQLSQEKWVRQRAIDEHLQQQASWGSLRGS